MRLLGALQRAGEPPSYHDLFVTTPEIPRTSIFNLPYGIEVHCSRTSGWSLWDSTDGWPNWHLLAGEYDGKERWLILDVAGHVIVNSRDRADDDGS